MAAQVRRGIPRESSLGEGLAPEAGRMVLRAEQALWSPQGKLGSRGP